MMNVVIHELYIYVDICVILYTCIKIFFKLSYFSRSKFLNFSVHNKNILVLISVDFNEGTA